MNDARGRDTASVSHFVLCAFCLLGTLTHAQSPQKRSLPQKTWESCFICGIWKKFVRKTSIGSSRQLCIKRNCPYHVARKVEAVAGHHAEGHPERRRPPTQEQQHSDAGPAEGPHPQVVQETLRRRRRRSVPASWWWCSSSSSSSRRWDPLGQGRGGRRHPAAAAAAANSLVEVLG